MVKDAQIPATPEAAVKAGYKRFEQLPAALQHTIRTYDQDQAETFALKGNPCAGGGSGVCSTTRYPDGTTKVCYCTPARQCDDCHFLPGGAT